MLEGGLLTLPPYFTLFVVFLLLRFTVLVCVFDQPFHAHLVDLQWKSANPRSYKQQIAAVEQCTSTDAVEHSAVSCKFRRPLHHYITVIYR